MIDVVLSLLRQNEDYVRTLEKAVAYEENKGRNPNDLGWEWYDVQTYGSKLPKLVVEGVAIVNFKSRSSTNYKLVDREGVKAALRKFNERRA